MTTTPFARRSFRFGVQMLSADDRRGWVTQATRAESLGYAVANMPDHFTDQFAPVPALQTVLDHTTTLRAGALVLANDYRHPVVLAKELATMDVLSDGRVEIGLGAGWMVSDYEHAGIVHDRAGIRVDRFVEALAVVTGLMADGPFSFAGEHYQIDNYDGLPKPVQRPRPPLLVGGGGPRVLRIAARHADIVGINASLHAGVIGPDALATMAADVVDTKVQLVAEAAAERKGDIELHIRAFMVDVTDHRTRALGEIATAVGRDPDLVAASPFALVGSVDKIVEDLLARRERYGFSYVTVGQAEMEDFAPVVARLAGQ
jgi:probable F420-dependent oxidoreductase